MKTRMTLAVALLFSLALSLTAARPAFAQAADETKAEAAKKVEGLAKQLDLSADQKKKLIPVLAEEAPKLKALKEDTSLTGLQKLQKLKAIHAETDPKIKDILSADQYQKWETIRQEEIHEMIEKKRAGN